jgi:hypothetical protein
MMDSARRRLRERESATYWILRALMLRLPLLWRPRRATAERGFRPAAGLVRRGLGEA